VSCAIRGSPKRLHKLVNFTNLMKVELVSRSLIQPQKELSSCLLGTFINVLQKLYLKNCLSNFPDTLLNYLEIAIIAKNTCKCSGGT
jgi:hypothetical protein